MPFEVVYEPGPPAVAELRYVDPVCPEELLEAAMQAAPIYEAGCRRFLFDFSGVEDPSRLFTLLLQSQARSRQVEPLRRAVVDPTGVFSTQIASLVLESAGKPFTSFNDRESAIAWLCAED
jgi:hypothetical protein